MRVKHNGWAVLGSLVLLTGVMTACSKDDDDGPDAATGGAANGGAENGGAENGGAATGGVATTTGGDAGAAGADSGTGGTDPVVEGTVEIFSWWTSGGEAEALDAVIDVFETENPEVDVVNAVVEYAEAARETLAQRMADHLPPDTFQANIGADLLRWVGAGSADLLEPLGPIASEAEWDEAFPEALLAGASKDGELYGVPMNVHRINSLFYDKRLFAEFDLEPPTTLDELFILVEEIKTNTEIQALHAEGVAPLALGNQWDWTLSQVTFEHVLPAVAGPAYYEDFWAGRADPSDPEMTEVLKTMLRLRCGETPTLTCDGYFNEDTDTVDWAPAVGMLVDGRAAMAPMGDWAKGYLEGEGLVADVDFGVVPFPGSVGTFIYTADTFPLPKGAPNRAGAVALLNTFASIEGQVAFNAIKGSIPARSDFSLADFPDSFDTMHQATAAAFKEDRLAMAMSGLLATGVLENLSSELKASMQAGTIEIVQNYLINNYAALQ